MNEEPHIEHLNAVSTLSRRGLLKQARLLGLGALGIGSGFGELVPTAGAAGTQLSGSQPSQRSPQRSRKTAGELLTVLQNHQGGKEALEAAKKGSSRLSMGRIPSNLTRIPPFSVVLFPGHLQVGKNTVTLKSVEVLPDSIFFLNSFTQRQSKAIFKIDFPQHGWYLVNIEALQTTSVISARIREMLSTNQGRTVQTWDYPESSGPQRVVRSFPAVYEYKNHKFPLEFSLESGGLLFQEVRVEAL